MKLCQCRTEGYYQCCAEPAPGRKKCRYCINGHREEPPKDKKPKKATEDKP